MSASVARRWPPIATGIALVAACLAVRECCAADEQHTWFLGHAFGAECAFRLRFGIPCPNCGVTRAVILALHGEWARAWRIAPGGPALVIGTLVSAVTVMALGIIRMRDAAPLAARAESLAPRVIYVSAALVVLVWFAGWIAAVAQALAAA